MRIFLLLLLLSTAAEAQTTHAIIVTGLAGDPRVTQELQRDGQALAGAITGRFGGRAILLSTTSTPRSDRAGLYQAILTTMAVGQPQDQVLVVLMGHASAEGGPPRFNIPGPDITADEISGMLNGLRDRETAVVMATSSSGAFVKALSGPRRIIVTATRSGSENEEVAFPRYFARALSEDGADINKDGGVSIAEAFEFARREVSRFYEQNKRLPTEHALLDDNGDGTGSLDLDQGSDGARARQFVIRPGISGVASDTVRALQTRRSSLEMQIANLKSRKDEFTPAAYDSTLSDLLVKLARVGQALRAAEAKP